MTLPPPNQNTQHFYQAFVYIKLLFTSSFYYNGRRIYHIPLPLAVTSKTLVRKLSIWMQGAGSHIKADPLLSIGRPTSGRMGGGAREPLPLTLGRADRLPSWPAEASSADGVVGCGSDAEGACPTPR